MTRKIHFYKASTRLGILNPHAILTHDFLSKFNYAVTEFEFPKPEDVSKDNYISLLTGKLKAFKTLINKTIKNNIKRKLNPLKFLSRKTI